MINLLDNSSISLFVLEIPQYDFLKELYANGESLNISYHVVNEFRNSGHINKLESYIDNGMINLEEISYDPMLKMRYPYLGAGELSIIQWGLMLKGSCSYRCILDDLSAREVAKKLNLPISGSIGLIILLKYDNGYSDGKIEEIIGAIESSDFRISKKILNKLRG